MKDKIAAVVDARSDSLKSLARAIFSYEEIAFQEVRSSRALADYLEKAGFEVEWGMAGMETAFVARYGCGRPHIGLMGEYDALPEVGHACGHNMIGTISAGAAVAIKESGCLEGREGTILFLGCPAEEHGGGKVLLDGAGVFNGLDAAMIIHPASTSTGYDISFAIKRLFVEFFGKAAHAAAAPHKGVNALDAMLSFFNGIALMRQQMTERTRVHGIILNGGQSFNMIPDYTKAEMGIRALRMEEVLELETRLAAVAEGAARATGCTVKITQAEPPQPVIEIGRASCRERV